jgi:hypothetical protein
MARRSLNEILTRLARAESAFLASEFLAPVVLARGVKVSIAGVRCTLRVIPASFFGWGIFRPLSHHVAQLERRASAGERQRYLSLFPSVQLIVCSRERGITFAIPAQRSDHRFDISAAVEVQWAEECDLFDTIVARFDGSQFWFDRMESRADPAVAAYLRREAAEMTEPEKLERRGLTEGERAAYSLIFHHRAAAILADERHRGELRLHATLAQAGASLRDFGDAGDSYRVTYNVDGVRHVSVVRKDDLTVLSAGICLSGQDRVFDLNSLVGVLREGEAMR